MKTKVLLFSQLIPGTRFEVEVENLEWETAKNEIQSALVDKFPTNGKVIDLITKHDAHVIGTNTQLTNASLLPSDSGQVRLAFTARKDIDSGNLGDAYASLRYNELRRVAKEKGITGLGSNPTTDILIAALKEKEAIDATQESAPTEKISNLKTVETIEELVNDDTMQVKATVAEEIGKIESACAAITEAVKALATASQMTLQEREALAKIEAENQEMLDIAAMIEVKTIRV